MQPVNEQMQTIPLTVSTKKTKNQTIWKVWPLVDKYQTVGTFEQIIQTFEYETVGQQLKPVELYYLFKLFQIYIYIKLLK